MTSDAALLLLIGELRAQLAVAQDRAEKAEMERDMAMRRMQEYAGGLMNPTIAKYADAAQMKP